MPNGSDRVGEWLDLVARTAEFVPQEILEFTTNGSPTGVDSQASDPVEINDNDDDNDDNDDDEDDDGYLWEACQLVKLCTDWVPPPAHVSELRIGPEFYICTIPTSPTTWGTYLLILRGAAASQAQEEVHDHLMRKWEPTLRAAQDTSPSALANLWRESTHEAMREWGEDQQSGVDPLLQTDIFQLDHVAAHDQHHLEVHAGTLPQYLVVSFEEFPLTAVSEDGTARFELQSMFE
ncbi:hypothetical protein EHS25_008691 [Saitozyma podzolica]|uniref:Uncharacterized protein n=1 Tax=Saitozyma podzolica TaxID=1890683 RepID=A0A427YMH5_9TREE|nr:hypothetical protein EHS25_008691 [Saitozyma podzolica]